MWGHWHWSKNKEGICLLDKGCQTIEDLPHILLLCPALQPTREKLIKFTLSYCDSIPHPLNAIILSFLTPTHPQFCQFLVDCSSIAEVISLVQLFGRDSLNHLFHVTRTWCYTLHRERLKMLGRWNAIWISSLPPDLLGWPGGLGGYPAPRSPPRLYRTFDTHEGTHPNIRKLQFTGGPEP